MSVRLFRMYQRGSHWKDFREIWYWIRLRKSIDRLQIRLNSDTLIEDLSIFYDFRPLQPLCSALNIFILLTVASSFAIHIERIVNFYSNNGYANASNVMYTHHTWLPCFTFRFLRLKFCMDNLYVHPVTSVSFSWLDHPHNFREYKLEKTGTLLTRINAT
jgi:hypothetical protein